MSKRMDTYMRILISLCATISVIAARPHYKQCPNEKDFVYYAVKCCEPFAEFAYETPTLRQICRAYRQAKPCMDKLMYACPSPPSFKGNDVYINWLQVAEIEAYCWY